MQTRLLSLVFLAGCISVDPKDGVLKCDSEHPCPDGYVCFADQVVNHCYLAGKTPDQNDLASSQPLDLTMPLDQGGSDADLQVLMGVSSTLSTIDFAPVSPLANGRSSATITITVKDVFGLPMQGKTVSLAATGSSVVLSQPTVPTAANGVTIGSISSSVAEQKTITATVDGVSFSAILTFAAVQANSLIFSTPPGAKVNNALPTLAVTALDADSQLLTTTNVVVTLDLFVPDSANPGQVKPAPAGAMTGPNQQLTNNGIAQFSGLTIAASGTGYEMRASVPGAAPPVFSAPFEVTSMSVPTPGNVQVSANHSTLTITWNAVAGAAKYNIYRTGAIPATFQVTDPTVQYVDQFLVHGTWGYSVDAQDGTGLKSAPSSIVSGVAERELCVVGTGTYAGVVAIPATAGAFAYPPLRAITSTAITTNTPTNFTVDLANNLIYLATKGSSGTTTPLYVYNRTDSTLSSSVSPVATFNLAHPAITPPPAVAYPQLHGVALDPPNSELVVVDSSGPALIAYNLSNTSAPVWTLSGSNVSSAMANAWGLAIYNDGSDSQIYVSANPSNVAAILKFSRNTILAAKDVANNANVAPALTLARALNPSEYSLATPQGLSIYLGPSSGPQVNGKQLVVINETGSTNPGSAAYFALPVTSGGTTLPTFQFWNAGTLSRPIAAAIDPAGDTLFMLNNASTGYLTVLDTNGAPNGGNISITGGTMTSPTDVAFCN